MRHPTLLSHLMLSLLALSCGGAHAIEFNGSGFLTFAVAKKIDSELSDGFLVVDYGQAGIYDDNDVSIGPDSKLGLQGTLTFDPQWSATAQIVSRGAQDGKINLEWLYATYQATDKVTLQFGRKRLPLFYYSESQDVGISLPWVRLPPQAYGWDVVNFTGANLIYRSDLGAWSSTAEVFYGNEQRKKNPYQEIYIEPGSQADEKWSDIFGADWTLSRDWLELRFSAIRSNWEVAGTNNGSQTFLSAAAMVDYADWVVRSEVSKIDRPDIPTTEENDWALMFGVGHRFGKWLPMATYSKFFGNYSNPDWSDERTENLALSLRYDLSSSSALKLQFDITRDNSTPGITLRNASGTYGDSKLFTIAYDRVF